MQLKKIKRAEKKGTESVMDEKFALLFQSKFQTGDMQLNVNTYSLNIGIAFMQILVHIIINLIFLFKFEKNSYLGVGHVITRSCYCAR